MAPAQKKKKKVVTTRKTPTRRAVSVPKKKKNRRADPFIHPKFGDPRRNNRKKTRTKPPVAGKIAPKKSPRVLAPPERWFIRVARFNPTIDFTPRTHEYTMAPHLGESVLDLLTRIKHTQDGSLTFRTSCGYGGCGTCGVRVNGKPVLGCVTQVKDHLDTHQGLRIDPLESENLLKDLVTDEKPFFDQLHKVKPFLVSRSLDAKRNHKMGPNDVKALGKSPECILCGLCNANADAAQKPELGPAAFVKGYRYANDIRDADTTRIPTLATQLPVHYSLEKANLCPRDIFPGDKIRTIKAKADKSRSPSRGRKGN